MLISRLRKWIDTETAQRSPRMTNHDCIGSWTVHWGSSSGATIWPSRIWMMRSPKLAASGLWVIIMTVWPRSLLDWRSMLRHDVGILGIQVPGWFVGEHDGRFVDKRSGQRYALLFSARQLRWTMRQPVCEPQQIRRCDRSRPGSRLGFPAMSCAISMLDWALRVGKRLNF